MARRSSVVNERKVFKYLEPCSIALFQLLQPVEWFAQ